MWVSGSPLSSPCPSLGLCTATICNFDEEPCISLGSPKALKEQADLLESKIPPNKWALTTEGAFRELILPPWT